MLASDPSEAVRSDEIVPLLAERFDIVERTPLGGSLLQFLLHGIAGNLHDAAAQPWLELLFEIEDRLMALGEIQSDFVYLAARSRK